MLLAAPCTNSHAIRDVTQIIRKDDKITLRLDVYAVTILDGKGKRIKRGATSWVVGAYMFLYGGRIWSSTAIQPQQRPMRATFSFRISVSADASSVSLH